jgi:hypothetical protein
MHRSSTAARTEVALSTEATTLNPGPVFHYVGVQFYLGAWQGDRTEIQDRYVGTAYRGARSPGTRTVKESGAIGNAGARHHGRAEPRHFHHLT